MNADPGMAPGKPGLIDPTAISALVAAAFDPVLLPVLAAVSAFVVELLLVAELLSAAAVVAAVLLSAATVVAAELLSAATVVAAELLSVATVVMAGLLVAEPLSPVPDVVDLLASGIVLTTELLTLSAKLLRGV